MNLIVIQATDEELETMTLSEIVAKSTASAESSNADSIAERETPYTVQEASKATNLKVGAIYERVKSGSIRKVPHTARVLIPAAEIKRLCA